MIFWKNYWEPIHT